MTPTNLLAHVVTDVGAWDADTVEGLTQEYAHTAENPMRFVVQRWRLALRVARMVHTRIFRSVQLACQAFAALKVTRKKLTQALGRWVGAVDKLALANSVPREFQIGKYGEGLLTLEQKCELLHWVRAHEKLNIPVRTVEAPVQSLPILVTNPSSSGALSFSFKNRPFRTFPGHSWGVGHAHKISV